MGKAPKWGVNTYKKINLESVQEDIKNVEINTRKEWANIVEKVEKNVDKTYINDYIGQMKEIKIKVKNISSKQWPLFLVELNLMAKMWKKYGPIVDIKAKNFDRIIKWGKRKHGDNAED